MRFFLATVAFVAAQFAQVYLSEVNKPGTTTVKEDTTDITTSHSEIYAETPDITKLAAELQVAEGIVQERLTLVAEVQKLEFWDSLAVVEQERLRTAIITNTPVPYNWAGFLEYTQLAAESAAAIREELVFRSWDRYEMMFTLPRGDYEVDVLLASLTRWWEIIELCQRNRVSRLILRSLDIPLRFNTWHEAVLSTTMDEFVAQQQDTIWIEECPRPRPRPRPRIHDHK